jgi:hypothetical protein
MWVGDRLRDETIARRGFAVVIFFANNDWFEARGFIAEAAAVLHSGQVISRSISRYHACDGAARV